MEGSKHAPAGIDINGKTPQEVAISILAEIIQEYRSKEVAFESFSVPVAMYTGLFNYFRSLPKPDRHEQTNLFMQTRYLATDVILATYTEQTDNYFGEKKDTGKMTFSIVLRKTGGKWLIELVTLTPVISQPAANN